MRWAFCRTRPPQEGEGIWADFFGKRGLYHDLADQDAANEPGHDYIDLCRTLPQGKGFLIRFVEFGTLPDGTLAEQVSAVNLAMEHLDCALSGAIFLEL